MSLYPGKLLLIVVHIGHLVFCSVFLSPQISPSLPFLCDSTGNTVSPFGSKSYQDAILSRWLIMLFVSHLKVCKWSQWHSEMVGCDLIFLVRTGPNHPCVMSHRLIWFLQRFLFAFTCDSRWGHGTVWEVDFGLILFTMDTGNIGFPNLFWDYKHPY